MTDSIVPIKGEGSYDLEEEVSNIQNAYEKARAEFKSLVSVHSAQWIKLGRMLIEHRKHVEEAGHHWGMWTARYLPFLKERRRQQCTKLAMLPDDILEPFYPMGFDRMYEFFTKLVEPYGSGDELLRDMGRFGLSREELQEDDDDESILVKTEQFGEFLKAKKELSPNDATELLLIVAARAGCKFNLVVIEDLKGYTDDAEMHDRIRTFVRDGCPLEKSKSPRIPNPVKTLLRLAASLEDTDDDLFPKEIDPSSLERIEKLLERVNAFCVAARNTLVGR